MMFLTDMINAYFAEDFVTNVKIPARYYIDDKAYRFTGNNYPSVEEVQNFTSWNK